MKRIISKNALLRMKENDVENLTIGSRSELYKAAWDRGYQVGLEAAQPKWISVEERLPEDRATYLTVVRCLKGTWVEINNYDHLEERWEHDMGEYSEDVTEYVTHWINLPEPPKEATND